jgi:hypothetical protein
MAAGLRRGVVLIFVRVFCGDLRSDENTAHQNGAQQRVTQFHCSLPQKDLDRKRPNTANLAHIVNGFQTTGTRCEI